jgi:hypothetical protein
MIALSIPLAGMPTAFSRAIVRLEKPEHTALLVAKTLSAHWEVEASSCVILFATHKWIALAFSYCSVIPWVISAAVDLIASLCTVKYSCPTGGL